MNELIPALRQFVDENFLFGVATEYSDDDSFLENGIVDSTGVLELIAHLEGIYRIKIRDEELVPENLDSIAALTRFIKRKRMASPIEENSQEVETRGEPIRSQS